MIHIGLPKTGTTTLQSQVFPLRAGRYLGVQQPREVAQTPLYRLVIQSVLYPTLSRASAVDEVRRDLGGELARCRNASRGPVVISEEMFTVGDQWRDNLSRLAELLDDLDYTVLVTWRDPVAASFSYYCELYDTFRQHALVQSVVEHEAMKIFWGDHLADALQRCFGVERVAIAHFDELFGASAEIREAALRRVGLDGLATQTTEPSVDSSSAQTLPDTAPVVALQKHNRTIVSGSEVVREIRQPRIRSLRTPKMLQGLRSTPLAKLLRSVERHVQRTVPSHAEIQRIPMMTDSERGELSELLVPQAATLGRFRGGAPPGTFPGTRAGPS